MIYTPIIKFVCIWVTFFIIYPSSALFSFNVLKRARTREDARLFHPTHHSTLLRFGRIHSAPSYTI